MAAVLARSAPVRTPPPRAPSRIVVREVAAPARRRSTRGRSGGEAGIMGSGITIQRGIAAYALGALKRTGQLARIPHLAQLGAEATVSLVAGFVSAGKPGIARDIALVSGIVALSDLGRAGLGGEPGVSGTDPFEVQGDDD